MNTENTTPDIGIKQIVIVLTVLAAGSLAIMAAKQMSAEALAVVVGVVCGVAAAIPTSLLLLVVLTRSERRRYEEEEQRHSSPGRYPPVVVIRGGATHSLPAGPQGGYWPPEPQADRPWQVVGGEDFYLIDGD